MNNQRNIGIAVVGLGLLLSCCLCPVAVNSVIFLFSNGRTSLYGQTFSSRIGNLTAATYISATQLTCSAILALIVSIVGIVLLVQSRRDSSTPPQ
jgi:hypothetical protein